MSSRTTLLQCALLFFPLQRQRYENNDWKSFLTPFDHVPCFRFAFLCCRFSFRSRSQQAILRAGGYIRPAAIRHPATGNGTTNDPVDSVTAPKYLQSHVRGIHKINIHSH